MRSREKTRTKKTPGYSLIEVGKQLHAFFAGDDSHLNLDEINQILKNMKLLLEALGYMPDTIRVLHYMPFFFYCFRTFKCTSRKLDKDH